MSIIQSLCQAKTDLDDADIRILEHISASLQYVSDLNCCDAFIDCLDRDGIAFVVAESNPRFLASQYAGSLLGQSALRENEPAVYHAFEREVSIHNIKAMTQENMTVKQDATPIQNSAGRVIGVMICERDVSREASLERRLDVVERERQELFRQVIAADADKAVSDQAMAYTYEAYHRIKNDLQTLASICNVRIRQSSETETKRNLQEVSQMMLTIASLYEMLSMRGALGSNGTLSLRALLTEVIKHVKKLMLNTDTIDLKLQCDEINPRPERAKAVAMVVLELITNAINHAFPNGTGSVDISVHNDSTHCSVVVEDDGVGFVEPSANSKGLSIASSLVNDKLEGSFSITTSASGTMVAFTFTP
ncbi:MAG: sensor histidine kinase [Clostridiaceae bacterium]